MVEFTIASDEYRRHPDKMVISVRLPASCFEGIGAITQVARKAGIDRVNISKALSPEGNPEFVMVLKVVKTLGLRLHAATS